MSLEKKDVIELVLTLVAVIAGSIAASGAFVSASYEQQRVALEEKPAIFLSCEPEFTTLDAAQGRKPEENAVFLDGRGASWVHIANLDRDQTPAPFARCTLTNYGRLPLLNLRLGLALQSKSHSLDVPGLAAAERFTFSLINGTNANLRFAFAPTVQVTRVDNGLDDTVVLFLSRSLIALQAQTIKPATVGQN
ncbi:MAG TPA: hypothetical protein VFO29_08575 [Candidatus Rubrimentiphilum sp.]|nr:hypothetical protein [Candidatus Rubrimentiphilum sp.]